MNGCFKCDGEFNGSSDWVACERCVMWVHMACVGLRQSKALSNKNMIYMCDRCLDLSRKEWKSGKESKDESAQTENCVEEKGTQMEDRQTRPQSSQTEVR